ncbi:hypothetical protein [Vibrio ouci]|uniref:Uncharacterized protein n=1 Tax=Vibrio ouci TaxID=2499078 RepID=A0A4Y8WKD1_9VIBR|nr:hypothetical protein [Vibrio ouci]TFH93055.1 hypothetical protein ELS82_03645 [Vibrio ouci]
MNFKRLMICALLLLAPIQAFSADSIASGKTYINRVISYNEYGSGDVVFRLANPSKECFGYWINKGDPGFNANLSMIIAAYQAKTPLIIHGLPAQSEKWKGSGNHWCKLYAIDYRD